MAETEHTRYFDIKNIDDLPEFHATFYCHVNIRIKLPNLVFCSTSISTCHLEILRFLRLQQQAPQKEDFWNPIADASWEIMGFLGEIIGFGIGIPIGLLLGFLVFIYFQPTDANNVSNLMLQAILMIYDCTSDVVNFHICNRFWIFLCILLYSCFKNIKIH